MRPRINHYDCHAEIETKHTVSGKLVAHISLQLSTRDAKVAPPICINSNFCHHNLYNYFYIHSFICTSFHLFVLVSVHPLFSKLTTKKKSKDAAKKFLTVHGWTTPFSSPILKGCQDPNIFEVFQQVIPNHASLVDKLYKFLKVF